ncbi:MAG: glycosyltransferase family 2 protein [Candidatus Omnitrophica bacterium]|nr:glycosyltransferase family 2 protein [Candidatus Omnitrophota bacterium]
MKRAFEIIPGLISWSILLFFLVLVFIRPLMAAVFVITYLFYWVCRLLYMSALLVTANYRMLSNRDTDWLGMCKTVKSDLRYEEILHIVLYTACKESKEVLKESLNNLKDVNYPKDKMIVILAGEEREKGSGEKLKKIAENFKGYFKDILTVIHPENISGEIAGKGANATYAAKKAKELLKKEKINLEHVIISCFDADTCPDRDYFSCLTYHFLSHPKRYQISFQPLPIYSNNIYKVPAFARMIEIGSTFWQLIESMRYEKFVTFSSHSMSFKTLVEVNYWPVDLVSDDSLIFWKCFLKYNGDYKTYPLEVPVYMDIAVGRNFFDTVIVQYKQKRRWAWGVENFAFLGSRIFKNKVIPRIVKIKKLYQLLDNHVNWATWAIIISFITPLILFWGKIVNKEALVLFNLSYINSVVFNTLSFIVLLSVFISRQFIPPRPKDVSRLIYVSFLIQWFLVPLISALLGSIPALDAQTRLMLGKYLGFYPTPKKR